MKYKTKPTLTIGIPAYNEGVNLVALIDTLFKQENSLYRLEKIFISSDGSTDSTVRLVRSLNNNKIKLFANKSRQGKSRGLNQIIKNTSSDILVFFDADIQIYDKQLINKLIEPILNSRAELVSGAIAELPVKTMVGKIISFSVKLKNILFNIHNHGNNIYHCHGPVRAFSRQFYTSLIFPAISGDDMFSYLSCIKNGYRFIYQKSAEVFYNCPSTFIDHSNQSIRFQKTIISCEQIFGKEFVKSNFKIPLSTCLKAFTKSSMLLLSHPVESVSYSFFLLFLKIKSVISKGETDKWIIASSSKQQQNLCQK